MRLLLLIITTRVLCSFLIYCFFVIFLIVQKWDYFLITVQKWDNSFYYTCVEFFACQKNFGIKNGPNNYSQPLVWFNILNNFNTV